MKRSLFVFVCAFALASAAMSETPGGDHPSPYANWKNGPSTNPAFFPIAVWLQDPSNAQRYKAAGFNTYVGLWKGPTDEQLAALKNAGIRVFCEQNAAALRHLDDPVIAGWMHGDEPDNAQELPGGKGYGPPVAPEQIVTGYEKIRAADPTRPVMLNLGQGVAWDGWYGRGTRSRHPEDYPLYIKGSDIVSFDIYPFVHENMEVRGKPSYIAEGVDRLVKWSNGQQVVWNCIECTHIGNPELKATPRQVRYEAWLSIIHGSRGLIYFVHQFKPVFREAALLDDPEMLKEVTALNQEITSLAPVLNSRQSAKKLDANADVAFSLQVDAIQKVYEGNSYIFAVVKNGGGLFKIRLSVPGLASGQDVEVLGENRTIKADEGSLSDDFAPWGVHIYRIPKKNPK